MDMLQLRSKMLGERVSGLKTGMVLNVSDKVVSVMICSTFFSATNHILRTLHFPFKISAITVTQQLPRCTTTKYVM